MKDAVDATLYFLIIILPFVILPIIYILRKRIPKTSDADIGVFQRSLPEGYGYPYYLDKTGYDIKCQR